MKIGGIVADPATRLMRGLVASAAAAGCDAAVTSLDTRPWASMTYVGTRHVITLSSPACAARYRWLAGLADLDLPIRGHVVLPPAILRADENSIVLETLTLENH